MIFTYNFNDSARFSKSAHFTLFTGGLPRSHSMSELYNKSAVDRAPGPINAALVLLPQRAQPFRTLVYDGETRTRARTRTQNERGRGGDKEGNK